MSEGKKLPLADAIEAVVEKMVDAVAGKIPAAPLQPLATSIGILIDKMQLLRTGAPPPAGDDKNGSGVTLAIAAKLVALAAGLQAQPVGPGATPPTLPVAPEAGGAA